MNQSNGATHEKKPDTINMLGASLFDREQVVLDLKDIYGACSVDINGNEINVVLPRDDTFLPPSVSNEYYDAVWNVMDFGNCDKESAIDALQRTNNDVVKAIQIFHPEFEEVSWS